MKIDFEIDGEKYSISEKGNYPNGRLALQVYCEEGPFMTLTHNFPDAEEPVEGYFHAKYWSENYDFFMKMKRKGILDFHPKERESFYLSDKLMHRSVPILVKIKNEYINE